MLKLYDYFRSSAAFRVRIALNLKGLNYEKIPVNLLENEQNDVKYLEKNPFGLVPSLLTEENQLIHQSLAIIEYLDVVYPTIKLIPSNPLDMVYAKSIAYDIAMDIHPLNNRRVLNYLVDDLAVVEENKNSWYKYWVHKGFNGLENFLKDSGRCGKFCLGDTPTIADICLVPQVFNAKRFKINLDAYPLIKKIDENCLKLDAFKNALPEKEL